MKDAALHRRISLWLLPPEPLITTLSKIQSELISQQPKDRYFPRFLPHVTLIGGVPISDCRCSRDEGMIIDDDVAAQIVLGRLNLAFRSHGYIMCDFVKEGGVFTARPTHGDGTGGGEDVVQWSQSCVSVLERSPSLMRAIQLADEVLFRASTGTSTASCDDNRPYPRDIDRHFKPPLFEPHYSFMYGKDAPVIPASLECPPSFASTDIALVWTDPSTLEGVQDWEVIGRVSTKGTKH
ncbi:hypothetical protein ACHAXA_003478 [Cyclostephanos tholiformis]|uniref:2',3'-cyclic-nucleotide 3'-phosphodiesterase n=1 Tax=Cyclostephanos tholiformis TaxID=382380 RepID=A0ABD3SF88_9STRA